MSKHGMPSVLLPARHSVKYRLRSVELYEMSQHADVPADSLALAYPLSRQFRLCTGYELVKSIGIEAEIDEAVAVIDFHVEQVQKGEA